MKLVLPNASSARGASMGRRNNLPADTSEAVKLHLERLKLVDGDYDKGGAYWGYTAGTAIYCAWGDASDFQVRVYVRATSREHAKELVREDLTNATFYR